MTSLPDAGAAGDELVAAASVAATAPTGCDRDRVRMVATANAAGRQGFGLSAKAGEAPLKLARQLKLVRRL